MILIQISLITKNTTIKERDTLPPEDKKGIQ